MQLVINAKLKEKNIHFPELLIGYCSTHISRQIKLVTIYTYIYIYNRKYINKYLHLTLLPCNKASFLRPGFCFVMKLL